MSMTNASPHQQRKLLSFCGNVLTFHCQRSAPGDGESRRGLELAFSRLTFQRDSCSFSKANSGIAVIKKNSSSDVYIVACSVALHVKNRITSPCILLVQNKKRDVFNYTLLSLSSSNTTETHMEFKLSYRIQDNVTILQGPTALWSHDDIVFYTSLQSGEIRQVPIKLSPFFIGEFPLNKRKILLLGSQTHCRNDQLATLGGSETLGYFVEDGQVFNGALVLPHAYSSITLCMCVVSAGEVNGVFKSSLVAATSKKQLVYFENGIPREVCRLPFEEPEHIQIVDSGRNGCLFVVSFSSGHVCTVWKDTFQVALCWSSVRSLHVDDFVGCGTDQILLVFRSQSAPVDSVENFLITDLCGTSYSQGQESSEELNTSDTVPENYLLTVQALQSRLQSGLMVLQDLQRDMSVKERVLRQSLQSLTDMVSGREHNLTQTEQESLVSLWDEDEEEAMDMKNQIVTGVRPLLVEKLWHRVIEDRLVVGVILTSECAASVESVTLSILTEGGQSRAPVVIETQSRGSWFTPPGPTSPSSHPEPAAKRGRQDGADGASDTVTQKLAVTAVTDLTPLLTSGSVKFPVMLHYTQRQESTGTTTAPGPTVVQCGEVRVDIQAKPGPRLLDDSRLTTGEAVEDLLSLLAVLETWTFLIYSPGHTLCDVAGWIQRSVPCERLEINPRYLLSNPAGPSAAMLFNWEQTTSFQGKLSVHCSQFQLLRFLDSLCVFLPASCSVLPLRNGGGKGTSSQLALSLEKEVLSLKQGVSSLLCGEELGKEGRKSNGARVTDPPDPSSADGLQRCREEWERSTQRSRSSLCPLVDVERYRRLTQSLAQVRLEGDLAALLEAHTHTHSPGSTL